MVDGFMPTMCWATCLPMSKGFLFGLEMVKHKKIEFKSTLSS